MKTEKDIQNKILEHEMHIETILQSNREEWNDSIVSYIEECLQGRRALLWVLSDERLFGEDKFEKQAMYECLCYESSKIF